MKRIYSIFLSAVLLLSGCSRIPRRQEIIVTNETPPETEEIAETVYEEIPPENYEVENVDFSLKLNAEGGVFSGTVRTDGEYDGQGYVSLDKGKSLTHIADVRSSQHYRVVIAAHSYTGAAIRLSAANQSAGTYYIPAVFSPEFQLYEVDNLYLNQGYNLLTFEVINGSAAIDYITIEDSGAVSPAVYSVSRSPAANSPAVAAIGAFKFLTDNYGSRTLTAQNVTIGTNAEIDAVYTETGRYPAIRCGDLAYSSPSIYKNNDEKAENEINLALDWGKSGGFVSFTWHWYSPSERADVYASQTDFRLEDAVAGIDIANASEEELDNLVQRGTISESCRALIRDIDAIAKALSPFKDAEIPVIWQPVPDGDGNLYWWGGNAENYKWLWNLIFKRLDGYHKLNNLLWVWNGSDSEYYPGDNYCDIIGQSIFENSTASFSGRLSALADIPTEIGKAVAITACDKVPKIGAMYRDNAMWLWFAVNNGEYIMNTDGTLSEKYTNWQTLHDTYNSTVCITKDELPDFGEYAVSQ